MIEHMCVLSTAHITQEVAQTIDDGLAMLAIEDPNERPFDPEEWVSALVIYPHGEFGWLIYIPDEGLNAELPPSLDACVALARANHCPWLLLDRDAAEVVNIPTYDW